MPLTQTQALQAASTPGGIALNVAGSEIAAGSVTKSKIAMFAANGKTGTGSSQSIPHGLGVVPSFVTVIFTGSTASQAVTYGTHTTGNIVVTVTSGAAFDVLAFG